MTARTERWRFRPSDVLLPSALGMWAVALHVVRIEAIDDWGLLSALPVAFYLALALLVASIALVLTDDEPSALRLVVHVVALVVVLHGTVPLLFPEPNYPWVYKHVGVVAYINAHGSVNPSVDIYQNWPAFFALAGWFTRIAGVGSPLAFAKWAPLFFNLLFCLELGFVVWSLPLSRRARWLTVFLFAAANWVGQDYFAPQALAFALGLGVFGIVLRWLQWHQPPRLVQAASQALGRVLRAGEARPEDEEALPVVSGWPRALILGALIAVFAVVVIVHQLSPYLLVFGLVLLAAGGMVRPRWVIVVLGAMTFGYLALHLTFLRHNGDLTGSPFNPRDLLGALNNPFDNAHSAGFDTTNPMPGRAITALGSPALILGLWALAGVGALRRVRAGRRTLMLVLLAAAPTLLALGQNYGGEAIFRIYLFSLPWTAALVTAALAPGSDSRPSSPEEGRWSRTSAVGIGVGLAIVVLLFLSAFYGSIELYRVRPGAVAASQYYFDHAKPGSVLGLVSPNVPGRIGAHYDQFMAGSAPPALSTLPEFQHHPLGPDDLPALSKLYREHADATPGDVFLSLSADQQVYVEVLRLMPKGALDSLDRALASSSEWQLFYRNGDAVIYRFLPEPPPLS